MKKKISALFLAVSMMTAMAIPAMAAEFTPSVEAKLFRSRHTDRFQWNDAPQSSMMRMVTKLQAFRAET